jgi:hypothetical protein
MVGMVTLVVASNSVTAASEIRFGSAGVRTRVIRLDWLSGFRQRRVCPEERPRALEVRLLRIVRFRPPNGSLQLPLRQPSFRQTVLVVPALLEWAQKPSPATRVGCVIERLAAFEQLR